MARSVCIVHGNDLSVPNAGTNRVVALAKSLFDHGFDVHLVIPTPQGRLSEDVKEFNLHVVPIKVGNTLNKIPRASWLLFKAKKIAKENSILQIQLSTLGGFATLIGYSDFVLAMDDLAFESPVYTSLPFSKVAKKSIYEIEKRAVSHASKIIVVSNSLKNFIIKEWSVPEEKIEVIPNGYFEAQIKELEKNNSAVEKNMITRLGTLFKHLNIENVINLARSLEKRNMKIYLIGDGELRSCLRERIRRENIGNIVITGWLPYKDAIRLTAKARLTFCTVKRSLTTELACPVKILDYAALGKPMVLSDVSELSGIFRENDAALVSDPENPDEFIENVHILLEDNRLREKIAYNAMRLAKDFTWEKQGEKLVRMYEELM